MNDNMKQLIIIAAIAIYKNDGAIKSLAYMTRHGFDLNDAIDILALYDKFDDACKLHTLH